MKSKQFVVLVMVAFIGGIVGGFVSNQLGSIGQVFAQGDKKPKIIEANEFRVVDDKGKILAAFKCYENKSPAYASLDFFGSKRGKITPINIRLRSKGLSVHGDYFHTDYKAEGMNVSTNPGSETEKTIFAGMHGPDLTPKKWTPS